MMRVPGSSTVLASIAVLSAVLAGGCNDPEAPRATALRQEKARRTAGLYAAREADSRRQMADSLSLARRAREHRLQRHFRNRDRLRRWAARDLDRWNANRPRYRQRIAEEWAGDPDKITWTVRSTFY